MASTIVLNFINPPSIGDNLQVNIDIGSSTINLTEFFVMTRMRAKQTTAGMDAMESANNYFTAWNLDHKNTGYSNNLLASVNGTEVTITLQNNAWQFLAPTGSTIVDGDVTYTINNATQEAPKTFNFGSYDSGDCDALDASFSATGGTGSFKVYVDNVLSLNGVASPFQLNLNRGESYTIKVNDTNDVLIGTTTLKVPRKIISNDLSFSITNLEQGASIQISHQVISSKIEPYTYSLDGTNYQSANSFSGIANGNYTVYVKDAFGCVATKPMTIDGVTQLTEVVCTVSEINALRFAKERSGKKNIKNTLSCHELKSLTFPFYHRYRENDTITTQFRTNAPYINVYRVTPNGTTDSLTPVKQTENIGVEIKTTATYYDLGGGRSALYFGVVDKLDPLTDAVLETVDYGFILPEFANRPGEYLTVEGLGQIPIDSIGYSDTRQAFVAEFNISYTGAEVEKTVYAKYNKQPYEIYEFTSDMSLDHYNIVIETGRDADDITHTYISEGIKKVADSDNLLEIDYKDSRNKGDMNYQTGITHKMLIEGYSDYVGEQDTEGYNGDEEYYVTDNTVFDSERFVFDRLSSAMAHKLRLVFAHETVSINGLGYKISESPEINTNINNNLKTFSVILKRGGDQFLDNTQEIIVGSTENEVISGAIEASQGKSLILWTKQNA